MEEIQPPGGVNYELCEQLVMDGDCSLVAARFSSEKAFSASAAACSSLRPGAKVSPLIAVPTGHDVA
jgi:hypothetical protein